MTTPDPSRGLTAVSQTAHRLLDLVVNRYAQAGVALPARRSVEIGVPAEDEPLLAVYAGTLSPGAPGTSGTAVVRCPTTRQQIYIVGLVRCISNGDGPVPPSSEDTDVDGTRLMDDLSLIHDACLQLDPLNAGIVLQGTPLDALGGLAGSATQVTVTPYLDSYVASLGY